MVKILTTVCVFLAVCALYFNFRVDYLKNKNTSLESEKTSLKNEIKGYKNAIQEYNDAQERAGKTIEKVRTIVRTVKSDCDCYNTALPDDVRRLLNGGK
jgi:archaellum component FlaC